MTDYEWPDAWETMTTEEQQKFLWAHRERLYKFWQAKATYQTRREERVNSFRVDEPLE